MSELDSNTRRPLRTRAPKEKDEKRRSGKLNSSVVSTCLENTVVEEVYLQANARVSEFRSTGLETIYEAPKGKNTSLRDCMGVVKLKRHCRFSPFYNPSKFKIKLRKTNSKNLIKRAGIKVPTGLNVTLEQVEKALQNISGDENEENEGSLQNINHENSGVNSNNNEDSLSRGLDTFSVQHEAKFLTSVNCSTNEYELGLKSDMKDELSFENFFFFSKHAMDKSKRDRRRAGRIQPLSSSNPLHLLTPLHIQTKDDYTTPLTCQVRSLHSHSTDAGRSNIPMTHQAALFKNQTSEEMEVISESSVLLDSIVNISASVTTTGTSERNSYCASTLGENILSPLSSRKETLSKNKKSRKCKQKTRKVSGIHRPLYKNLTSTPPKSSSPEEHSSPIKCDFLPEGASSIKLLSPSLFEQLKIHSPDSGKSTKTKGVRRKSARLSYDGKQSCLGSVWIQSRSPNTPFDSTIASIPKAEPGQEEEISHSMDLENVFQKCTKSSQSLDTLNSEGNLLKLDLETNKQRSPSKSQNFLGTGDSPILTGIFNCAARVHKDKKFILKRGSQMCLRHFNMNSH